MSTPTKITNFKFAHWFNVATIENVNAKSVVFGIKVSDALVDENGDVITGNFFMNVYDPTTKQVERIFVPTSGTSADGLTIGVQTTGEVTRGLVPSGMDPLDGDDDYAMKLKPGMVVAYSMDPIILNEFQAALLGNIATGGVVLIGGNETDSNFTLQHLTSGTTLGFLRKNVSTSKVQFSNDGSAWVNLDNAGVGTITWGDGLNGGSGSANPFVELDNDAAFLTGGSSAQSTPATWAAVTDGSFRITINGTAYNIDAINFTGNASMAVVAATIQSALRNATGGLETVAWDTDHFVITSVDFTSTSEVSVTETSTGTVGTDISGAGAADWMDCDSGNGTATAFVENAGLIILNNKLRVNSVKVSSGAADENKVPVCNATGDIGVFVPKTSDAEAAAGANDTSFTTVAKVVHLLGNLASGIATFFTSTRTAKTTPVLADTVVVGDSAASNADKKSTVQQIHNAINNVKVGVDNWSPTAVSQTKTITHNLGRVPKRIKITAYGPTNEDMQESVGAYDGSTNACAGRGVQGTGTGYPFTSSKIIDMATDASTADWTAVVSDNSADSFTLNCDAFTTGGNAAFLWEVE